VLARPRLRFRRSPPSCPPHFSGAGCSVRRCWPPNGEHIRWASARM
jgi:hypothetical protein